jgi:hypothetical protein
LSLYALSLLIGPPPITAFIRFLAVNSLSTFLMPLKYQEGFLGRSDSSSSYLPLVCPEGDWKKLPVGCSSGPLTDNFWDSLPAGLLVAAVFS